MNKHEARAHMKPLPAFLTVAIVVVAGGMQGASADAQWPPGTVRTMRMVVDMDATFISHLVREGLDPLTKAQEWVNLANQRIYDDVAVRVTVTQWHARTTANDLATPTSPSNYLDILWQAWSNTGEHDVVLLLSGKTFGSSGVANGESAGQNIPHGAIVKEVATTWRDDCIVKCSGHYDAWMPYAIMHEVGHTIGGAPGVGFATPHPTGSCGAQDTGVGCDVMTGFESPPDQRLLEFSEADEQLIWEYVSNHLPLEE